jgi:hypothetical protein
MGSHKHISSSAAASLVRAHAMWWSAYARWLHAQDGGMAVRARMTPSHQSVEDVRRCVREAQAKGAGHGPQLPMSEFNEEVRFWLVTSVKLALELGHALQRDHSPYLDVDTGI